MYPCILLNVRYTLGYSQHSQILSSVNSIFWDVYALWGNFVCITVWVFATVVTVKLLEQYLSSAQSGLHCVLGVTHRMLKCRWACTYTAGPHSRAAHGWLAYDSPQLMHTLRDVTYCQWQSKQALVTHGMTKLLVTLQNLQGEFLHNLWTFGSVHNSVVMAIDVARVFVCFSYTFTVHIPLVDAIRVFRRWE